MARPMTSCSDSGSPLRGAVSEAGGSKGRYLCQDAGPFSASESAELIEHFPEYCMTPERVVAALA